MSFQRLVAGAQGVAPTVSADHAAECPSECSPELGATCAGPGRFASMPTRRRVVVAGVLT